MFAKDLRKVSRLFHHSFRKWWHSSRHNVPRFASLKSLIISTSLKSKCSFSTTSSVSSTSASPSRRLMALCKAWYVATVMVFGCFRFCEIISSARLASSKNASRIRSTHCWRIVTVGTKISAGLLLRRINSIPSVVFPEPGAATKWIWPSAIIASLFSKMRFWYCRHSPLKARCSNIRLLLSLRTFSLILSLFPL